MGCVSLIKGLDLNCLDEFFRKYYQNVILINRNDVNQFQITTNTTQHRIRFNLSAGKTGYLFSNSETVGILKAKFSKNEAKGINTYRHSVDIVVSGTSENIKTLLKQLDNSDYFAAIQFKSGDVEIYGFENGLGSSGYEYDATSGVGGSVINLVSKFDEYEPPYLYYSNDITGDFDDLFAGLPDFLGGDFNNDYSDDFYIT